LSSAVAKKKRGLREQERDTRGLPRHPLPRVRSAAKEGRGKKGRLDLAESLSYLLTIEMNAVREPEREGKKRAMKKKKRVGGKL